jgi:hypothetical protein
MSRSYKRGRSTSNTSSRKKLHTDKEETETPTEPAPTPTFDSDYAEFEAMVRGIGVQPTDPTETGADPLTTVTVPVSTAPIPIVPVPQAKPKNPWASKVKAISEKWGNSVHEQMHLAPTTDKPYHGVWGSKKPSKLRGWVSLAVDSIYLDDDFVVASKPGENGGYNFLVDMNGATVGYISGSNFPPGTKPPAKHLAVYVNKKGYPVTAFPCTPEIF